MVDATPSAREGGWRAEAERIPWTQVEVLCDTVQRALGVRGKVGAVRKVLAVYPLVSSLVPRC